jgi:hypothetical protein
MKISKQRLVELINEELEKDAQTALNEYGAYTAISSGVGDNPALRNNNHPDPVNDLKSLEVGQLDDIATTGIEGLFNNVQIASRILEDLPFEEISNSNIADMLVEAADFLRAVLDKISMEREREERGY